MLPTCSSARRGRKPNQVFPIAAPDISVLIVNNELLTLFN